MIKNSTIRIDSLSDVYTFIREASKVYGDVIIKRGKFVIDAKSVMGVFSIDMSNEVTISYPEEAVEFDKFLDKFKIYAE